jgi:hypothetical protein
MSDADLPDRIRIVLERHRGAANPIEAEPLAWCALSDERSVRDAIQTMRQRGELIGSRTQEPAGFYLIEDAAEAAAVERTFRSRALCMLKTDRALRKAAQERFSGQLRLPVAALEAAIAELEAE